MGLVAAPTTPLSEVAKLSVSKFARRRLAVVMARTGMVQNIQTAIKFVEQGHVRVGSEVRLKIFFFLFFDFLV
jgi:ribosomal protein S4